MANPEKRASVLLRLSIGQPLNSAVFAPRPNSPFLRKPGKGLHRTGAKIAFGIDV